MKKITILAISALFTVGCVSVASDNHPADTDTCKTILVPDTAPDSVAKTQYPDSSCVVTSDSIK